MSSRNGSPQRLAAAPASAAGERGCPAGAAARRAACSPAATPRAEGTGRPRHRPAPPDRAPWCAGSGCTNGRELPAGIVGDHVLGDAEEPAHPVQGRVRVLDQLPVAQHAAPAHGGSARRGRRAVGRTCPARGSARTAPTRRRPAAARARQASTTSVHGSSPSAHRCIQLEYARSTGSRSTATSRACGQVARRSAAGRRGGRGRTACSPPPAGRPRPPGTGRGSAAAARSTRGCCARRRVPGTPAAGESPHR